MTIIFSLFIFFVILLVIILMGILLVCILPWFKCFCFLKFPGRGISVCWYLIKCVWVACGSLATHLMYLAVALEHSIFLASWCTLLEGNLFKSMSLSSMVFLTNSSSLRKNQKISLCKILAITCGYLAKATCVCTVLYHSSTPLLPCLKLVSKSNLDQTSLDWGLQNSSNFSHITSRATSSFIKFQDTY